MPGSMSVVTTRALVLAGGGLVGIAWEAGVLLGLRGAGIGTDSWDRIVGTSAGSVVGAAGSDHGLDALREAPWVDSAIELNSYVATLDPAAIAEIEALWFGRPEGPDLATRAAIGRRATSAGTDQEARFIRTVAALLPTDRWPRPLVTTAVDAETGAFRTFDAASGVPLVAAVAASCAIPGVFPPVTDGRPARRPKSRASERVAAVSSRSCPDPSRWRRATGRWSSPASCRAPSIPVLRSAPRARASSATPKPRSGRAAPAVRQVRLCCRHDRSAPTHVSRGPRSPARRPANGAGRAHPGPGRRDGDDDPAPRARRGRVPGRALRRSRRDIARRS